MVAVAATVALLAAAPQPALAGARGIQTWGSFCVAGKCFPSGILEHEIIGNDNNIQRQWADASSAANLCNWRMDFVFYDTNNTLYYRNKDVTHNTCTRSAGRVDYTNRIVRYGKTCAEIYSNSTLIARQCHYITK